MNLSLNSFVPKPATPFQWHPFEDVRSLSDKIKMVKKGLQKEKGVFRSGRRTQMGLFAESAITRGPAGGQAALTAIALGELAAGLPLRGPQPGFLRYRPHPFEEILPWDFIDHGISKEFLWRSIRKP